MVQNTEIPLVISSHPVQNSGLINIQTIKESRDKLCISRAEHKYSALVAVLILIQVYHSTLYLLISSLSKVYYNVS